MALDDFLISTGVDNLIRLVKEKGKVEMPSAAKELKMPLKTVEDWSHVLEEEGLITIEYKLTKIYLVWKAPDAEYIEKKERKLEAKATNVKSDIDALLSKVDDGGQSLSAMQDELSALETAAKFSPADAQRMKAELAELDKNYAEKIAEMSERLEKLKKKAMAASVSPGEKKGKAQEEKLPDLSRDIARLKRYEETIEAQLADSENFFGDFEKRLSEMENNVQGNRMGDAIAKLSEELGSIKSLSAELSEAMAAVKEEQETLRQRAAQLERGIAALGEGGSSQAGRAKRLAEIRRMQDEAKRQKEAVEEQLKDALASLKKNSSKFEEIIRRQEDSRKGVDALKEEYVDIAEEISNANEELGKKRAEVSRILSAQTAALEAAKGGAQSKFSREEIQKVSFLLRELSHEQSMLEEKVRVLLKEVEILNLERGPEPQAVQQAGTVNEEGVPMPPEEAGYGAPPGAHAALVEKVKLTQEEQGEFDRKRDELRSLIRKMWEENKGS